MWKNYSFLVQTLAHYESSQFVLIIWHRAKYLRCEFIFPIDKQSDFWCFPVFSPKPLHCHIMVVSPVDCGDGCSWIFLSGFRFAKRSWMTQGNLFWKRIMWKRKKKNTDLQVIWKWKCCRVLPCCLLQYICSINLGEALAGELID